MDTYQITGKMVATNFERLNNPTHSAHADTFKAMMDHNLMDFRLLKDGVAELSYLGPKNRTNLTPETFVQSLTDFIAVESISALEFVGAFLLIDTTGLRPEMTQVVVEKTGVSIYEATVSWNKK